MFFCLFLIVFFTKPGLFVLTIRLRAEFCVFCLFLIVFFAQPGLFVLTIRLRAEFCVFLFVFNSILHATWTVRTDYQVACGILCVQREKNQRKKINPGISYVGAKALKI